MKTKLKILINSFLEKAFGIKCYSIRVHGREDMNDILRTKYKITTIFDVGANIGQSAIKFRRAFPNSMIYCFEPVKHVFEKLKKNLRNDLNTKLHSFAIGKKIGLETIFLTRHESTSTMIEPKYHKGTDVVQVETIDHFCVENGIRKIDLLKIDVEGFDLNVLRGASEMLSSGRVLFVLIELSFHPSDTGHVLFENIRDYLIDHGFFLFGIYDQQLEWSGENRLRYANACFIRKPEKESLRTIG